MLSSGATPVSENEVRAVKEHAKGPLTGIAVLDLSVTEAGLFAGTLFADMGADVVRVESNAPSQSPVELEPFVAALHRNRRVVRPATGQPVDQLVEALIAKSSVIMMDGDEAVSATGSWDFAKFQRINPRLIRCCITPFGLDGPWANRYGGDLCVQALSGFMELTGEPGRPPIRMGARVISLMAGAQSVIGVVSCLLKNGNDKGAAIDVSLLDEALNTLTYIAPMYLTLGHVPGKVGSGHTSIYPYNAFEVADGYIVAAPFTQRFWRNFCKALGVPEWADDERFRNFQRRLDNRPILEPLLNARMREKGRAEWLRILEEADVPCGPVNSVAEALEMDQSRSRNLVVDVLDDAGTHCRAVGLPLRFSGLDGSFYQPSYHMRRTTQESVRVPAVESSAAGERSAEHGAWASSISSKQVGEMRSPLAGIRVLDLTRMAAGPFCTQMLADLGAEVIKVEEPPIGDPTRRNLPMVGELSSYFYAFNRGKKSITVDMKAPEGNSIVRRLLSETDVVLENFRPGVMERLGLDYASVKASNPSLVFASISGFGQTGPMREKISFDLVNQAMAGMLSITSEPGRAPVRLGMAVGDLAGGLFACLGVVASLWQRERTGVGAYVDVSLHDVLVSMLGASAQEYLSTGVIPGPRGAEHALHVPEGVYATSDGWIALEAWTEQGWRELVRELRAEALNAPEFADLSRRREHRQEINDLLGKVFQATTTASWLTRLRKPGIGVAPIATVADALDSEHVAARDLVVVNTLPDGSQGRTIGSAFRIDGRQSICRGGPPGLGQSNQEILGL
jgi:crotonobetainyl-CoA:carnitine CoA-transferase CaiB-like acyl-CoA transferase